MATRRSKKFPRQTQVLKQAIFDVTGERVQKLSEITSGDINWVYKGETVNRAVVARVSRSSRWPDQAKLRAVGALLRRHKIPHAKLLLQDNAKRYFPYGLEISECVAGENGAGAIRAGRVSFLDFHRRLGKLVSRVHTIKQKRFGQLDEGKTSTVFLTYRFYELAKYLGDFKGKTLAPGLQKQIEAKVKKLFAGLESRIKPVLIHGDPSPDNCVLTPAGKIVLVDWDNARGGFWLEDFAWLTYFGSHLTFLGSLKRRRQMLYASFLKAHGQRGFSLAQIERMELGLHILQAAHLMGYFKFFRGDEYWFRQTRDRLMGLIRLNQ
ncbi:MAG: phosphotransferase [Patescibacteria group bacterium]|nr:phosphotransferase [Patescibacteria group bacterium]